MPACSLELPSSVRYVLERLFSIGTSGLMDGGSLFVYIKALVGGSVCSIYRYYCSSSEEEGTVNEATTHSGEGRRLGMTETPPGGISN